MEKVDLYEASFVKTGQVVERHGAHEKGHKLIVFACLFSADGRMLIQQRSKEKRGGGYWDVSAGGAVQAGESSLAAVVRETWEELGLSLPPAAFTKLMSLYYDGSIHDIYAARWDGESAALTLQQGEVSAAKWVTEEEALAMVAGGTFLPVYRPFLSLLFAMQTQQGIMQPL